MFEVTHSFTGVPIGAIPRKVHNGLREGTREVGRDWNKWVALYIAHIYARRIPTKAEARAFDRGRGLGSNPKRGGRLAWKRTQALRLGQRLTFRTTSPEYDARIAFRNKSFFYARRRQGLGVYWKPRKPALGIVRRDSFFLDTLAMRKEATPATFKRGFDRGMGT